MSSVKDDLGFMSSFGFSDAEDRIRRAQEVRERAGATGRRAGEVLARAEALLAEATDKVHSGGGRRDVPPEVSALAAEDRLLQWLQWHRLLRDLEAGCRAALDQDDSEGAGLHVDRLEQVCQRLESSRCANLVSVAKGCLASVRSQAAATLSDRLEKDLTALNYPQCVLSEQVPVGRLGPETDVAVAQFRTRFLLMVRLFGSARTKRLAEEEEENLIPAEVLCRFPSEIMLVPLRKRFKFHFSGNRKTNNPVRPEWFLLQTKLWLKNMGGFFDQCGVTGPHRLARAEVMAEVVRIREGLFRLVAEKLLDDLQKSNLHQDDDVLLSHTIDEVLQFTKDPLIVEMAKGVQDRHLPVSVLSQESVCHKYVDFNLKPNAFMFSTLFPVPRLDGSS